MGREKYTHPLMNQKLYNKSAHFKHCSKNSNILVLILHFSGSLRVYLCLGSVPQIYQVHVILTVN